MSVYLPRPFVVDAVERETADTVTLVIRPQSGLAPAMKAGQFAMLSAFGTGEVPISVSRIARDRLHHTIRHVGEATRALTALKTGDSLGFRGPFGTAWPLAAAVGKDLLVLAGGLGLAPLRPVLDYVMNHRDRFARVSVLYGTREVSQVLFGRDHKAWRSLMSLRMTVDHDVRQPDCAPWSGQVGVITKLIPKATYDAQNTVAMVCGPEIMMRFSARDLEASGIERANIHVSLERNMKCAVGLCGHCQLSNFLVCRDGAVLSYDRVAPLLTVREL